ncbi:U-scoloptoxin(11)-Sm7a-like [Stegodyphus dumicola]|uniref:U-scoloptoxin(11)-Sm7a-like n=1 Tax=Stegodyphus dumicola TaxID=202533 RepID=UPI0015A76B39|nr:U-scoloptoxin(11)-Sm7a-like [Stegodyphus dumicola]
MSLLTEEILVNSGFIHCICPSSQLLLKNDSHFHQMDNGIAIIATSYICKPPPTCDLDSICAAVTQNVIDHTSFVMTHCTCPDGFFCPTSIEQAKERIRLEKGSYYTMSCI